MHCGFLYILRGKKKEEKNRKKGKSNSHCYGSIWSLWLFNCNPALPWHFSMVELQTLSLWLFCIAVGTAIVWCCSRCTMLEGHCLNILLFWQRSMAALVFRVGSCFEVSVFCPPFPLVPVPNTVIGLLATVDVKQQKLTTCLDLINTAVLSCWPELASVIWPEKAVFYYFFCPWLKKKKRHRNIARSFETQGKQL